MELKLKRPLLFFDIESTGLDLTADSIIELSFVKVFPSGEERIRTWRVRPWDYEKDCQRPISPGAERVHGIKDEDLKDCPRFWEIAPEVISWLEDCDLAGYNSHKFDLPMLAEELERASLYKKVSFDLDLHGKQMVDVQTIFHKLEPRNLKAAYRFYCGGEDFENAHAAEADTLATYAVLKGQLDRYCGDDQLKNDIDWLARFTELGKTADYAGRLAVNEKGEAIVNFGKHKGISAREVFRKEPSYFDWIERSDFTLDTKRQFRQLKDRFKAEQKKPLDEAGVADAAAALAKHFSGK